ncbi:MAG: heavy metal-binding domain-containing protein [Bosea sp.]|jgi:uncharacterized protein YbjQ (UPF0145 family)|nr:heavy metal-binding domain-containing protein [Bosea sp. (in: a-proteobacteria)]
MLLLSTPTVLGSGFDEVQSIGLVSAKAFADAYIISSLESPVQDGTHYSSIDVQDQLSAIENNLINDIIRQARAMGGNAIVAMKLQYESIVLQDSVKLLIAVDGTAVQIRSR